MVPTGWSAPDMNVPGALALLRQDYGTIWVEFRRLPRRRFPRLQTGHRQRARRHQDADQHHHLAIHRAAHLSDVGGWPLPQISNASFLETRVYLGCESRRTIG